MTDSMKQAASDSIGSRVVGQLIGDMDSMTSFGRARTTGRLLSARNSWRSQRLARQSAEDSAGTK